MALLGPIKSTSYGLIVEVITGRYWVFCLTLSAPSSVFSAVLFTPFFTTFFVARPVFLAADPVDFPASFTSWPAPLMSSFAVWASAAQAKHAITIAQRILVVMLRIEHSEVHRIGTQP